MIAIDRKVCRDILKMTTDYNVSVFFGPALGGYSTWHLHYPENVELVSSVPIAEVPGALQRLEDRNLIKKIQGSMNGGVIFRITPELLHAKAFWWDRFTKKTIGGFVIGVLIGLSVNLLTGPIQSLISELLQLLSRH